MANNGLDFSEKDRASSISKEPQEMTKTGLVSYDGNQNHEINPN